MPDQSPSQAHIIGKKLRTMRQKQQMSLRELAAKAEISASMLSQIETGKVYPSVRSIYGIAAALSVPVDYFFPDPVNGNSPAVESTSNATDEMTASELRDAKVSRAANSAAIEFAPHSQSPVVHATARPAIKLKGGVTWLRLTAAAEPNAEFLEIAYAPGATSGENMSHHNGREFGLVLEGELAVELGFEAHTLSIGDSIIFDSTTPHRLTNKSAQPTRALWVVLSRT